MTTAMTDTELTDWLTDLDCGCQPTAEAFRALARRCAEAEFTRDTLIASIGVSRGEGKSWARVCAEQGMEVPAC